MSEACMHNPYEECFRNCEGCVRYASPENSCKYCENEDDLYDFGGEYVCGYCLINEVIGDDCIEDKEPVLEFVKQNANDFNEFAKRWFDYPPNCGCEEKLPKLIITDNGEIMDFDALFGFITEYDDLFQEFLKDWFSLSKVV